MKILKNKNGFGNIFKNDLGKICFFNKFSKYFDYAMKWKDGIEIDDYYFKVIKSFPKYNIIDINEKENIFENISLLDEPELKIIEWKFIDKEIEEETEYEKINVPFKGIEAKIVNYDYIIGLDVVKGKVVRGWKENGTRIEYFKTFEPVKYKFENIKNYIEKQFENEYEGFNKYIKHTPTGLYMVGELPKMYSAFDFEKMNKRYIVKLATKEEIKDYKKVEKELQYKKIIDYAPENIKENIKDYYKKFAHKKWDSNSKSERWYITEYVPESEDGFRREGYIDVEVNDDMIFKLAFPKEHEIAKEKFYSDRKRLEKIGKEFVILDLKNAIIED